MQRGAAKRRPWRLIEDPPAHFVPLPFRPGIRRIVAPNPGPMTYHGTNSWLVDWDGGTVVIDPGSEDETHLSAILREVGDRLSHIVLTHTHADHLSGAMTLHRRTGVPVAGFHASAEPDFTPSLGLSDGDRIAGLTVVHTPGHAMDHLCFAAPDGLLFSGDHVMGWSTSVVPPHPWGDLSLFIENLEKVRDRGDRVILSAHGPAINDPRTLIQGLLDHRHAREASIVALLKPEPQPFETLLARAYFNLRPDLLMPAKANLLAHLEKLEGDGRAAQAGAQWRSLE